MTSPPNTRSTTAINAVARETLRRIALERISPTPQAYSRIYQEIAGTHPDHPDLAALAAPSHEGRSSAILMARLLGQLEAHHAGITVTRKREGLKRALVPRSEPLDALFARLNRLMDSWNGPNAESGDNVSQFLGTDVMGDTSAAEAAPRERAGLSATAPFSDTDMNVPPRASGGALRALRALGGAGGAGELPDRVISFRLAGLLALLLKNIDALVPESALLGNQIEQIGRVLTAPLTEKKLDEAERCIRALIVRQGAIRHSIDETKRAVRDLASTLLDRLSTLVDSTDSYSTKVVQMAERIAATNDLGELSTLTQSLVSDARLMSASVARERALLVDAEDQVRALQGRTVALESELREASTLVRTDPLTGSLNRRGFGDAFRRETARALPGRFPSIALIDVDNFKRINEEYGHSVGDEVLCGLVEVLQRCAAPANIVSRYGGEEFALLFPAMSVAESEIAVLNMQRALSDELTSSTSTRPAVTFSAGLAAVSPEDALADVMTRADQALRRAKQSGKNCVVVADDLVPSGRAVA